MPTTKQQIRQIIANNNLNSVDDVYHLLKKSFKDILRELMETKLNVSLGYEKKLTFSQNIEEPVWGNSRSMSQEAGIASANRSWFQNRDRGISPV